MGNALAFWRRSEGAAPTTTVLHSPEANNSLRVVLLLLLSLMFIGSFVAPLAAAAQNLGTAPAFWPGSSGPTGHDR